ncbi:hypothetical protein [Pandoraea sp. CB10b_02]|uniref:hypothetical protein n=1 Tax=Pandoraea sp. CB10b_02 TaxID=2014535 RepID=UPI00257A9437|nr:hypothetical protein [Pandoraea sp. CB10b_02]
MNRPTSDDARETRDTHGARGAPVSHDPHDATPSEDERIDYRLLHEDGDEETIGTHHGRIGNGYWPAHHECDEYAPVEPVSDGLSTTGDDSEVERRARTQPRGKRVSDPELTPTWEGLEDDKP